MDGGWIEGVKSGFLCSALDPSNNSNEACGRCNILLLILSEKCHVGLDMD